MSMHLHGRRQIVDADVDQFVEFSDLLDPIREAPVRESSIAASTFAGSAVDADMAFADMLVADMLVADDDPTTDNPDVVADLVVLPLVDAVVVSRFADAGVDDDRLPLRTSTKRFRLR